MKIGFLVSSVSREAGGLFQSVRGLAKAVASTNANVRVFGMSDEQSVVDLQEWRPLSVQTFRPQFRAWSYSSELVPAIVGADLDILSVHGLWKYCSVGSQRWHQRVLAIAGWDQAGYESELKRIATVPSVVFLGPRFGAEKSECYRACDAFILPSLSEGLPMTVLEAWAYAKPVLMKPECNLPEGFSAEAAVRIGLSQMKLRWSETTG